MTLPDRIIRDTEDAYEVLSQLLIQKHILRQQKQLEVPYMPDTQERNIPRSAFQELFDKPMMGGSD